MKTHRFEIARYLPADVEPGTIWIDWPSVHRQAGRDHIQWLKEQDVSECQMIVERKNNDGYHYLVAEIYSDKLATIYSLMWAK
jgi:hypothetical protein